MFLRFERAMKRIGSGLLSTETYLSGGRLHNRTRSGILGIELTM